MTTPETLADRAYQQLRNDIAAGELAPGTKLTERGVAERLSISPTPVREALRRLELDGLIERIGPRTLKVAAFHESAVDELSEVEVGLRGLIARFAARHATPEQLDALDAILDDTDDQLILIKQRHSRNQPVERHLHGLFDSMQRFNDTVSACAHNPVLARMLEQSRVFSRVQRRELQLRRVAEDPTFGLDRYAYHRALVRALRAGDSAEAERIELEDAQRGLDALRGDDEVAALRPATR
ncbi:GntR family transcriptional regulator [Virgisporangium ochraceum]|uniref:GntR family transcriptional regulator n=1 Tax=Virgisporangium ochraceum TaxID=65505 RepID=A0A8J4EG81_9ACTN|nr:GntR family transcriptional regulator [Virgisporangium ochraceum]GIJ73629.1 GntR family transcriptional regulator [Virgisporangium ochraceum]